MLTQSFRFSEREEQSPTKLSLNCGCFLKCSPFYVKKWTGRIIQKIGRLVFGGGEWWAVFQAFFVCFWLVFLPGSFPCFYQFYLIFFFFFLFLCLFYLSVYLIITCLVCLGALRPCTSKNLFLFFFVQSVSLSVSQVFMFFSPKVRTNDRYSVIIKKDVFRDKLALLFLARLNLLQASIFLF